MTSRFLGRIFFTKEEAISLSKIRIIQKNLVHVHGFPPSLANVEKLNQPEYFGQYGDIQKTLLYQKINPKTQKKTFSVYITYSNEKEASFTILAVDSLLIEGKIIRAFFGTTKYCNYFLNNTNCPNLEKCIFLHQLASDKDIIIEPNTIFSYNEHLSLAKKIINFKNPETRRIIDSRPKLKNSIFPTINFIFLSEKEKENYFRFSDISYIRGNYDESEDNLNLNPNLKKDELSKNVSNNFIKNEEGKYEYIIQNKSIENLNSNAFHNMNLSNLLYNSYHGEKSNNSIRPANPIDLCNLFENSISHILLVKPLFIKLENIIPLKEMELDYFKEELLKSGNNIYTLLEGCLDFINKIA